MFWDFLKVWEFEKIRYFTIVGLIAIGGGIIGIIIVQSGEQATPTRVYELHSRTRPHIEAQNTPRFNPENETENIAADYDADSVSSPGSSSGADGTETEESETAADSTDSTVQRGWGNYDPPPPDPEQERIRRMEKRVLELQAEIEALSPQVTEAIKLLPRLNELMAEQLRLQQELGRLHIEGLDPFVGLEIQNLMTTSMTEQGLPVSVGPRLAELVEKMGDVEGAEKIRAATRKAIENSDEFFQPEHVDTSGEY